MTEPTGKGSHERALVSIDGQAELSRLMAVISAAGAEINKAARPQLHRFEIRPAKWRVAVLCTEHIAPVECKHDAGKKVMPQL